MSFEYPKKVRFRCIKCALCCGDVNGKSRSILLLNNEASKISRETGMDIPTFAEKIEDFKSYSYSMKKSDGNKCFFLKSNICSIYHMRPLICRFYPFKLDSINNRYVFTFTTECRGIGKGYSLKKKVFKDLFKVFKEKMRENEVY